MTSNNKDFCILDPNFTIVYMFLDKFSDACGVNKLDINNLSAMIQDSKTAPALEELHIKLLRKIRKSVPVGKWENALAKFAHTYSNQDAWELERFGYRNANSAVKLRILKVLLEAQFDRNSKFKGYINGFTAEELRSKPIGKDIFGNSYWCIMDHNYSIKIFRENMDDETWNLVASNRDELALLIEKFQQTKDLNNEVDDKMNNATTACFESKIILKYDDSESSLIIDRRAYKKDFSTECSKSKENLCFINTGIDYPDNSVEDVVEKTEKIIESAIIENCHSTTMNTMITKTNNFLEAGNQNIKTKPIFSDIIEDKILFVQGQGSGADNEMGNIKKDSTAVTNSRRVTSNSDSDTDDCASDSSERRISNTIDETITTSSYNISDISLIQKIKKGINLPNESSILEAERVEANISKKQLAETASTSKDCHLYILEKKSTLRNKNDSLEIMSVNKDEKHQNTSTSLKSGQYSCNKPKKITKTCNKEAMDDFVGTARDISLGTVNTFYNSSNIETVNEGLCENHKMSDSNSTSSKKEDVLDQLKDENNKCWTTQHETTLSNVKKRRKTCNIDTNNIIPDTLTTMEHPVRQSRRIAQQKIREETNRRLIEEKMLRELKAESIKNKKKYSQPKSEDEDYVVSEIEESFNIDIKTRKKKRDIPWLTSSSESSSESELEEEPEHSDDCRSFPQSDHEFSPESDVDNEFTMPTKRARTVRIKGNSNSDNDDDNVADYFVEHACQKCGSTDHPEWILLCDSCDKGYHCSCLIPVLFVIPEGDWYCPKCEHDKLLEKLHESLILFDKICSQLDAEKALKNHQNNKITNTNVIEDLHFDEKIEKPKHILKKNKNTVRNQEENLLNRSDHTTSSNVSSDNDSLSSENNKLAYKLRRRNQNCLNYKFNDYDDLINSAIRHAKCQSDRAGENTGGKSINNILELEKKQNTSSFEKDVKSVIYKVSKKRKRLNDLNSDDDDDGSDEDFSEVFSDDEEEESLSLTEDSESSLELRTSNRFRSATIKKHDKEFINDDDDGSDLSKHNVRTRLNKTKKIYQESDEFEDEDFTESEEIDSEDLCDDTETDSSLEKWKKRNSKLSQSYVDIKNGLKKNKKREKKMKEDGPFKTNYRKKTMIMETDSDQSTKNPDLPNKRRTRGKKLHYLLDEDFESSDDGITPGVLRPDTPPEERERFIQKQEEIKRMLAEKNTAAAKELATPTILPLPEVVAKNKQAVLSTIPQQVIDSAKALDIDLLKIPKNIDSDDFDDELAVNFADPDDVNEEELAKIMEDEDFASHNLKLEEDMLKNKNFAEHSAKKKIRDFESIDPADITKLDKKRISYSSHFTRLKSNTDSLTEMSIAKPNNSNNLQNYILPKSNSPLQYMLLPSDKASSLLQQMKQQAIPLRDCEQSPMQPSTLPHSNIHIPTTSLRQKGCVTPEKTLPSLVLESPYTDYANLRRRRRKKITPLRGDLYKNIQSEMDVPNLPQYHVSLNKIESVTEKNCSNLKSLCSKIVESPLDYRKAQQGSLYAQNSYLLHANYQSGRCNIPNSNTSFLACPVLNTINEQSTNHLFATLEPVITEDSTAEHIMGDPARDQDIETEKNSEFSGLVSYFSSQRNELNE
ncbi:remodeling and spacing factor 1 isoform X2 [Wyeomyia smithii]|uniref:remodeling and spacing factor 1 isoform X2 n=1 Tax=Wyeomyia smithii TaxID=174621 RepID=UPI00246820F4|nr:remodeling and spacing factor 1 isoform X2 [Wyeomyia smithii]